ncbi:MAG TPA: hypothetical protein VGK97_06785 [Spongiibacteraceae bacterium]
MRRLLLIAVICLFTACTGSGGYNPTVPAYHLDETALNKTPIKKVVIATANISGEPTRYYLQNAAAHVDDLVKIYLQKHGYQVAPSYQFENAWNQAIRTYGDMYDPTTGKVDANTYRLVMYTTIKTVKETTDIDAIIFTDVIERDAAHDVGMDHLAQWDGVRRKPSLASAGAEGVPVGFNWNQPLKVATLAITIYSTSLEGIFSSSGGLDTLQAINTKNEPIYTRRKNVLDNDDYIEEGIEIAFHPFIKMKNYPGDKK